MFRPILKLVREREGYVEQTKKDIVDLEKKIGRLKEEWTEREDAARQEAAKERTELKGLGRFEVETLYEQSKEEVAAIRTEAERKAEQRIKETEPGLDVEAANLVDDIVERIIGRRIAN